jgi:TonB-linked SusC/RagA family outer membrane protein
MTIRGLGGTPGQHAYAHAPATSGTIKKWLMRINVTVFVVAALALQVQAKTGAAQDKITIHERGVPLEKVLDQVQRQTGISYTAQNQDLDLGHPVTVWVDKASLKEVLDAAFKDQPVTYQLLDRMIVVRKKAVVTEVAPGPTAGEISGVVLNESGQPLSGASVTVKATGKIVLTDERGEFKLTGVPVNSVLTVTYVGYAGKLVPVKQGERMEIRLAQAVNQLDQVQIVAYGSTSQRLNVGDVSTVSSKTIAESPVSNPLAAIEGRVPGIFITQNTGAPDGSFTVQMRGKNSMQNGTDPLYVVDGVPYASELLSNLNVVGKSGSPFNFLNPSDIESVSILKDADATAIYGSRAANGVVLITTKKGKIGAARIDINAYAGSAAVDHMLPVLNREQYLAMRREAFKNDNATPTITNAPDLMLWDTTRSTDWQKQLIGGTAQYQDAQASVSGGNFNTQYLIGGGYHRETTVMPENGVDQKMSAHFSISSATPNRKFTMQLTGNYVVDDNTIQPADLTSTAAGLPPDAPNPFNADGSLNWAPPTPGSAGSWSNPYALLKQSYKGITNNLVGNAIASYEFLPGLILKSSFGYTNMQTNETVLGPLAAFDPGTNPSSGTSQFNTATIQSWIVEPQVTYKIALGKGVLSALVGTTFQQNTSNELWQFATGFTNDALLQDIQAATSVTVRSESYAQYSYDAVFGRVNYDWADKYILNLNARRDGSSRFGPSNQFANFYSVGGAWVFSKEKFFERKTAGLSFGKLRASYGTTGNDQIGDYKYLDLYTSTTYPYQNQQGLYPSTIYNPYLGWEETRKFEAGLELGFINDRVMLNANYYRNRSSDEIIAYPLSYVTGFNSITSNLAAKVQNSGAELTLNTTNIKSKNVTWSTAINLTVPKNKLLSFPGLATSPYATAYVIGQPITITKVYNLQGVNDSTGIFEFASAKGTPTTSPSSLTDRTVIENTAPKFYGGFQNTVQYKGFEIDILFQFVKQTGQPHLWTTLPGYKGLNQPVGVLDRWTQIGDNAKYQKFSQKVSTVYLGYLSATTSNLNYSDASFIRLKNVALSWELPRAWQQKLHFANARLYVQGQNLVRFTKYVGFDPESQGTAMPLLRVITGGFQLTL